MTIVLNTKGTILRLQLPLSTSPPLPSRPPHPRGKLRLHWKALLQTPTFPFKLDSLISFLVNNISTNKLTIRAVAVVVGFVRWSLLGLADDFHMTQLSDETTVR